MKQEFLKKLVAISMTTSIVTGVNSITVSAKWISNSENNWNWTEDGVKAIGWKYIDGKWYHFNDNGLMSMGWIKYNEDWYSLSNDGSMDIGWKNISGKWYHFDSNGKMKTGWYNENNTWYYMNPNGEMQMGNLTIDGISYNFSDSGQLINDQNSTKVATQSGLENGNSSASVDDTRIAYVSTNNGLLNVRSDATTSADIIGTLSKGSEIKIVGNEENGFYPLILNEKKGWVSSEWISFTKPDDVSASSTSGANSTNTTNNTDNTNSTNSTSSATGYNDQSQTNNSSNSSTSSTNKSNTSTKNSRPKNVSLGSMRNIAPTSDNKYYYSDDNIYYKIKLSPPFYNNGTVIKGNCTWYAFGRAWEISGFQLDDEVFNGNAYEWWNANIQNNEYQYGSTPRVGAIAVWKSSLPESGGSGHVAIVEKIDNGKVYISESTWNGITFGYREIYETDYMYGYIYLDKPIS